MSLLDLLATGLILALLATASVIDVRSLRLPDAITLSLCFAGITCSAVTGGPDGLIISCLGALIGFVALWMIAELYFRVRGIDGLGLGDAKLLAAAGAWLGPLALAPLVLVAALLALAFVGMSQLVGRSLDKQTAIPFGPFLSVGFAGLWAAGLMGWAI